MCTGIDYKVFPNPAFCCVSIPALRNHGIRSDLTLSTGTAPEAANTQHFGTQPSKIVELRTCFYDIGHRWAGGKEGRRDCSIYLLYKKHT